MYTRSLRDHFLATCKKGDTFIDATPLALSLPERQRVVNILDAHPSPALHQMIGNLITLILASDPEALTQEGVVGCE